MAAVKITFNRSKGPYREGDAKFQRVGGLPRKPQLTAAEMLQATPGERNIKIKGTDRRAPILSN
jgi:hypothetical protein